jgi:HD-GYP domain-containing protein (c-di-GMP phosphodiesterase class II)
MTRALPLPEPTTAFPRPLRAFTASLAASALLLAVMIAPVTDPPPWASIAVFAALVLFSEQRQVMLPNGARISAGLMVGVAAIVVSGSGALSGALVVGAAAGLTFQDLRRGRRGFMVLNASTISLSMFAAASVALPLRDAIVESAALAAVAAVLIALAVVVVGALLVSLSYWVEERRPIRTGFAQLGATFPQSVPFAVLGVFLGRLYLELGWPVAILFVVPILLARDLFASYLQLKAANDATVAMLISALEAKDNYTAGHAGRVAKYAQYIGEELGFWPWRQERLRVAALMHDIGKLVVPNHLLNKPGRLTAEEFALVRRHEDVSVQMLRSIDFLAPVAPSASGDHATYRSTGAAQGSQPIEPFIVAVADAFDAMTSTRSYRRALPQTVAFAELRDKAGTQFHPECVEALIRAIERRGEVHGAGHEPEVEQFDVAPPDAGLGSAGLGDLLTRAPESSEGESNRCQPADRGEVA